MISALSMPVAQELWTSNAPMAESRVLTVLQGRGDAAPVQVPQINRLCSSLVVHSRCTSWRKEAEQHLSPRIYLYQITCTRRDRMLGCQDVQHWSTRMSVRGGYGSEVSAHLWGMHGTPLWRCPQTWAACHTQWPQTPASQIPLPLSTAANPPPYSLRKYDFIIS